MFFIFWLLMGVESLLVPRRQRSARAGACFALATLARPDGLLYSACAGAYMLLDSDRDRRREALRFAATWGALLVPHFIFRLAYYGDPLPNTFYAKSGSTAYWSQGFWYLWSYVQVYFPLLLVVPAWNHSCSVSGVPVWLRRSSCSLACWSHRV
jgi:hypothetical protein